jgi:hypothetical protein
MASQYQNWCAAHACVRCTFKLSSGATRASFGALVSTDERNFEIVRANNVQTRRRHRLILHAQRLCRRPFRLNELPPEDTGRYGDIRIRFPLALPCFHRLTRFCQPRTTTRYAPREHGSRNIVRIPE